MNKQLVIAAAVGAGFMGAASASQVPHAPEAVRAPAGQELSLVLHAKGVQVYKCAQDGATFAWKFKGPIADLADDAGKPMGRHYGGPTWETTDGSKVVAKVSGKADAANPGAVPLLLTAPLSTLAIAMPPVGDTLAVVLAAVWLLLSALVNAAVAGALAHRMRAERHA